MEHVDLFGNLLWTAAVWSVLAGSLTDWVSSKISSKRQIMTSKVIVICSLMLGSGFISSPVL